MRTDKFLGVVAGCLLIGGFVGYVAALDSPPPIEPQATQWETLVAGVTAVFGGVLAYYGAITPHREKVRQSKRVFRLQVFQALNGFIDGCDPAGHLMSWATHHYGNDTDRLQTYMSSRLREEADKALKSFPPLPVDIASGALFELISIVKFRLETVSPVDVGKPRYLEEMRFQCLRLLYELDSDGK